MAERAPSEPDIFLSYAREDEARARELATALDQRGFSVFWDREVPPGQTWHSYIGEALANAKCVVVAWSPHSVVSPWVLEEASEGKDRDVLVPILFEKVQPPFGFRAIQAASLIDWNPRRSSPAFDSLVAAVERIVGGQTGSGTGPSVPAEPRLESPKALRRSTSAWSHRRVLAMMAALLAVAGGGGAAVFWWLTQPGPTAVPPASGPSIAEPKPSEPLVESASTPKQPSASSTENDPPVARDDEIRTLAGKAVTVGVLANDDDPDEGDRLRIVELRRAVDPRGSAEIRGDAIYFDPGTAFDYLAVGDTSDETLTYVIEDDHGSQTEAQLTIMVEGETYPLSDESELSGEMRDCPECPEMVLVPAGDFTMGSPPAEPGRSEREGPQRTVTIAEPLWVGKYEVSFIEWHACVAAGKCEPSRTWWKRDNRPVVEVSWNDAQAYVDWLSQRTGKTYRLLSEAEWEYVSRAGTTTAYWWGDDVGNNNANCDGCGSEWDEKLAPVGSFRANGFGLYDTAGNVYEWVQDCWRGHYEGAPTDGSPWFEGDCSIRIVRGGSYFTPSKDVRSAARFASRLGKRPSNIGVRIARAAD